MSGRKKAQYNGIAGSKGVGIGRALVLKGKNLDWSAKPFTGTDAEAGRLKEGIELFKEKTLALAEHLKEAAGEKQAEILLGQIAMLEDPFMAGQFQENINKNMIAEAAVTAVCNIYIDMFSSVEDELTRQRAMDVKDMRDRLTTILMGAEETDLSKIPADSVIVARDLTPSMTAEMKRDHVAAIVTETGGFTSHSAILARAMSIPAVLSVPEVTDKIPDGALVVVDGEDGSVILSPERGLIEEYQRKLERQKEEEQILLRFQGRKTVTAEGIEVALCANIGSHKDIAAVLESTAEGVGLFRTEFLFMDRNALPSEEEQFDAYRQVAEAMGGKEVIIRTLDVGGDKEISYMGLEKEENPFLGFRAIRYCLEHKDVFKTQLRAILRAGAFGNVKIMLPLITRADELRETKALIRAAKAELQSEGLPFGDDTAIGVMIETPASVMVADILAAEADFFSIGTNDLIQYIMAVDRGNTKAAKLYTPYDPAVLRAVRQVIRCGKKAGIPVGMCGEAAGDPLMIPLLLAFGLDEFSMTPSNVLAARSTISGWTMDEAKLLADEVMELSSAAGIYAYLKANVKRR